ncbi:MAG: hypothetical protein MZV65_13125 [Chromatiales bacterium]|nr:hypothetical protein [Chromatiales bacterium]
MVLNHVWGLLFYPDRRMEIHQGRALHRRQVFLFTCADPGRHPRDRRLHRHHPGRLVSSVPA